MKGILVLTLFFGAVGLGPLLAIYGDGWWRAGGLILPALAVGTLGYFTTQKDNEMKAICASRGMASVSARGVGILCVHPQTGALITPQGVLSLRKVFRSDRRSPSA